MVATASMIGISVLRRNYRTKGSWQHGASFGGKIFIGKLITSLITRTLSDSWVKGILPGF